MRMRKRMKECFLVDLQSARVYVCERVGADDRRGVGTELMKSREKRMQSGID